MSCIDRGIYQDSAWCLRRSAYRKSGRMDHGIELASCRSKSRFHIHTSPESLGTLESTLPSVICCFAFSKKLPATIINTILASTKIHYILSFNALSPLCLSAFILYSLYPIPPEGQYNLSFTFKGASMPLTQLFLYFSKPSLEVLTLFPINLPKTTLPDPQRPILAPLLDYFINQIFFISQ